MRKELVLFAVACLVVLPLFAASNAPVQDQAVAPAPVVSADQAMAPVACAQQAVAPVATSATATALPLDVSPPTSQLVGACNTDADCTNYCLQRYGSPYGRCFNFRCTCFF